MMAGVYSSFTAALPLTLRLVVRRRCARVSQPAPPEDEELEELEEPDELDDPEELDEPDDEPAPPDDDPDELEDELEDELDELPLPGVAPGEEPADVSPPPPHAARLNDRRATSGR